MSQLQQNYSEDGTIRGYDDDRNTRLFVLGAFIGGIVAAAVFNIVVGAIWSSPQLYVISNPESINAGKITSVTFITISNGAVVGDANVTLSGAAAGRGRTDSSGMLVLAVNATYNGSINVVAEKSGYENATSVIRSVAGLDITASPSSITSGTATYVTFTVTGSGKPAGGALVNISGAGISLEGITDSSGQLIKQVNAPNTGKIAVAARKEGYIDGGTVMTSSSQQTLSLSSSHSTLTVNLPAYVTFTVTAGGSAVNDAVVTLSGAVAGSGITNQEGRAVIYLTPYTTGTITASASRPGYAGGSISITSAGTQSLSIVPTPGTVTAGVPSYVSFTVTSGNNVISEALVTLTGAAGGNGVTNQNGQAIIFVNSTIAGVITATVSKAGYSQGSTTLTAAGQQTLSVSANPSNITNGVTAYVTFTVTGGGSPVSGAIVSVSGGGISTDGMTNSAGQVTLQMTASGTGTINAITQKPGYADGKTTLTH